MPWTLAGLAVAWLHWNSSVTLREEVPLRIGGEFTDGVVVDADEGEDDDGDGQTYTTYSLYYEFDTREGTRIKASKLYGGHLPAEYQNITQPVPTLVEYLPRDPSINFPRSSRKLESPVFLTIRALLSVVPFFFYFYPAAFLLRRAARRFSRPTES